MKGIITRLIPKRVGKSIIPWFNGIKSQQIQGLKVLAKSSYQISLKSSASNKIKQQTKYVNLLKQNKRLINMTPNKLTNKNNLNKIAVKSFVTNTGVPFFNKNKINNKNNVNLLNINKRNILTISQAQKKYLNLNLKDYDYIDATLKRQFINNKSQYFDGLTFNFQDGAYAKKEEWAHGHFNLIVDEDAIDNPGQILNIHLTIVGGPHESRYWYIYDENKKQFVPGEPPEESISKKQKKGRKKKPNKKGHKKAKLDANVSGELIPFPLQASVTAMVNAIAL